MSNEFDGTSDDFKQALDSQKIYVKEMMKNLKETNKLEESMKHVMNNTLELLMLQPLHKNRQ